MTLFTLIIPHFNSKNLIRRLLDSIQKGDDIQIIVVDDCSTEPSILSVSKDPAYSHVNFIFSEKKLTAGGARNVGLHHAVGKYIVFADSDDFFSPDAFDIFRWKIESNYDLYQFKITSFIEGTKQTGTRHLIYTKELYKEFGLSKYLAIDQPVAKLINHDLIKKRNIRFSEVPAGNDVLFSAKVTLFAKKKKFINKTVYNVSQSEDSITAQKTESNLASRIKEQTKKTELITANTPSCYWITYLCRRNIFRVTKDIHKTTNSRELHELADQYNRTMPVSTHIAFHAIQFFKKFLNPIKLLNG